jgi:hypothetical protein
MHFLNTGCATILIYTFVTRGALGVARVLAFAAVRIRS